MNVWATAGVSTMTGIDSWAYSFARYGHANNTLHVAGSGNIELYTNSGGHLVENY